jgi:hypothetical protein
MKIVWTQFWFTKPKSVESSHQPKETRFLWVNPVVKKSQEKTDKQRQRIYGNIVFPIFKILD